MLLSPKLINQSRIWTSLCSSRRLVLFLSLSLSKPGPSELIHPVWWSLIIVSSWFCRSLIWFRLVSKIKTIVRGIQKFNSKGLMTVLMNKQVLLIEVHIKTRLIIIAKKKVRITLIIKSISRDKLKIGKWKE